MTRSQGQVVTLVLGLLSMVLMMLVFMTGRFWGLPLDYAREEHLRLLEIALPPFAAIAGMAVYSATSRRPRSDAKLTGLYATLILAPPLIFIVIFLAATYVFTRSNMSVDASAIFSLDEYRTWLMILLSLIAGTTSALSLHLYR